MLFGIFAYLSFSILDTIQKTVAKGGKILFVATKKQAAQQVADLAKDTNQFYVNHRWLGGMMTNYATIQKSITKMKEIEVLKTNPNNEFTKKENFTRFVKSKFNTTKDGKIKVEILKGQESFRIKSFVKSNIWVLLPAGKSKFKKGDIVDCFFPNLSNQNLV